MSFLVDVNSPLFSIIFPEQEFSITIFIYEPVWVMENLIQPCSHSAAAFIALPIMVVIEKSSILIPGVLILISHLIFCDFALSSFSAIRAETI